MEGRVASTRLDVVAIMLRLFFRNVFGTLLLTGNAVLAPEAVPVLRRRLCSPQAASEVDRARDFLR